MSSYTRAINKQENRSGSLFQQNTKIKPLNEHASHGTTQSGPMICSADYPFTCFHYIHQNPWKAKLTPSMEDYEMSSFRDYAGMRNGTLCNKALAVKLLDILVDPRAFVEESYVVQIVEED